MSFLGTLHPYQEEATQRFINRKSLLIAFGCGTGKTVMAINAAEKLGEAGEIKQCLILCPASLKYQWSAKIEEFTGSGALVIDGPKHIRHDLYRTSQFTSYIIASYDAVIHDYDDISKLKPEMIICDEISAIKSFKAIRSKRVKKLFSKTPYRLGLTATPIENKPEELYSIMQLIDHTVLGRYDLFEKAYITRNPRGWVTHYKNLDVLRGRMGDAMARKTRHDPDVRPYLPDVDEGNWTVPMPKEILKIYKIIAEDMLREIEDSAGFFSDSDISAYYSGFDESTPPGRLMAMHMCMEMLLNHPDLLRWSARQYQKTGPEGSEYAENLCQSGNLSINTPSVKVDILLSQLEKLLADPDSKIIIVSKYKYMLQLLSYSIPYPTVTFNGDMSAKEKALAIENFSYPANRILLTSHAGGWGLDLFMADCIINYDLPWSAGAQEQINSRHVRASSNFDRVYVRNMITENSIEERKLRMLERKSKLSDSAIDGRGPATVSMSDDMLRTHLEEILGKPLTSRSRAGKMESGGHHA